MDASGRSMKHRNGHPWISCNHSNLSHSMFSRWSRHHYSQHYSRRNPSTNCDILKSLCKIVAKLDEEKISKLTSCFSIEPGCHEESKEKAFCSLERVRSDAFEGELTSSEDVEKMLCGICSKLIKRKPSSSLSSIIPTIDTCIVAVLACAHVYHADCLEQRTLEADQSDPPCPVCNYA